MSRKKLCLGFSLLETSVVLAVIGLLLSVSAFTYIDFLRGVSDKATVHTMGEIQHALLTFAATNRRLPCADVNGNGFEGNGVTGSCAGGVGRAGSLPYKTLFMDSEPLDASHLPFRYGVYRNSGASADLTVLSERTADAATSERYLDAEDFVQALRNAQGVAVATANEVYVTGDGVNSGLIQCGVNIVSNVAYVLMSGGYDDLDGANAYLDGVNGAFGASLCVESPTRPHAASYDDYVVIESFVGLTGKLWQLPEVP
ncbi:MAG: type II secretion system protein [Mariprofundaceae bacterium]